MDTVRFYLNGALCEEVAPDPTTTVLDYLREQRRLTGTKEGCAEGDCGACTVVVVERDGDGLRVRPVNACIQFLPTLDGKALFTVEGLKGADGGLHPVQQAMVDCHGSQCGFCTPGFVMALFALYKTNARPDRDAVVQALSGNLCRCTGYRPIIEAAQRMYDADDSTTGAATDFLRKPGPAGDELDEAEALLLEQLDSIRRTGTLVIDNGRRYVAPLTLDELARCIDDAPDATVLAGGTDVGLWHTKQFAELPALVYLGDVEALRRIEVNDGHLCFGAAVSLADAFEVLCAHIDGLDEIVRRFASPPICHSGTLVGNIANGSPIGDSMPALLCLGARLVLRKGARERRLSLDAFYLGYRENALDEGEFVAAVEVPRPAAGTVVRSYKLSKRYDQDISAVCGAYARRLEGDRVADIAIAYGGMAAVPKRAPRTEAALLGESWRRNVVDKAAYELVGDFQPIGDMRASDAYRSKAAANLLLRFFLETSDPASVPRVFGARAVTP